MSGRKKSGKLIVVKLNTKARTAALITIDRKPEAIMQIIGDRRIAGIDTVLPNGKILRMACNSSPTPEMVRWTFQGNGFKSFGGWVQGDAVFVGYDPLANDRGEPGVISVPVDAKFIQDAVHWFDPEVDVIGSNEEEDAPTVEGEPGEGKAAEVPE